MSQLTAVVTGGGRGIGRAIVDRLQVDGAQVVTCGRGRRPQDLPEAVHWVQADVSRPEDAARIVDETNARHGRVSLLVNNAGVQLRKTLIDTTDEDWELLVGVNCRGPFNMSRSVLPDMTQRGGGVIINIGSISGVLADPSTPLYNASKSFIHGLTRSIALDHGPEVRCNAVLPGWVETDMLELGLAVAPHSEAKRRDAVARHPLRRLGTPADIADAVAWLASPESAFVTGQCFTIDGGLTAATPIRPDLA